MKDVDEVEVEICRAELEEASAAFTAAQRRFTAARTALADAASPWAPGDYVRHPEGTSYRVDDVIFAPGDELYMLRVEDETGSVFTLKSSTVLVPANPWPAPAEASR